MPDVIRRFEAHILLHYTEQLVKNYEIVGGLAKYRNIYFEEMSISIFSIKILPSEPIYSLIVLI